MGEVSYDLAIIGGGPGGYAAALRAAQLNLKTVVIEKDKIGGTCLHRGCVPTASLLESAAVMETVNRSEKFGVKIGSVSVDWQGVQKSKKTAVNRLFMGLKTLFKQRNVDVINGMASLNEPGLIKVENEAGTQFVKASYVLIATGSSARTIPGLPDNPSAILDTTGALNINEIPKSIAIVGGGPYGVEFASLFRSFGSDVTIIEEQPRLMPREDKDLSKYLEKAFKKRGIKILTGTKLKSAAVKDTEVELELSSNENRQAIISEKALVAVGRTANTGSIDIEALGIRLIDGFIETDTRMRAGTDGIYAVGDVTCGPLYAHAAFSEGIYAAEIIAGLNPPELNLKQIPTYSFGYPELARVGYTEDEAREAGFEIDVIGLPFQVISRSAINREDIGFAKIIARKDGPIIGIHLVGPDVVSLIPEAMLITNWEATTADVGQFLHPHPTFTEAIGEAILKLAGKPLHAL